MTMDHQSEVTMPVGAVMAALADRIRTDEWGEGALLAPQVKG